MADISHLSSNRHVQRATATSPAGLGSLAAHLVFIAAIVFASALVFGLLN